MIGVQSKLKSNYSTYRVLYKREIHQRTFQLFINEFINLIISKHEYIQIISLN